jgi:hypothetical protein
MIAYSQFSKWQFRQLGELFEDTIFEIDNEHSIIELKMKEQKQAGNKHDNGYWMGRS